MDSGSFVTRSVNTAPLERTCYCELQLVPGGFRLVDYHGTLGPTRDPHALGTALFAFGLGLTYDSGDAVISAMADDILGWANTLSRIEQEDFAVIPENFDQYLVDDWAQAVVDVCQSASIAKEVLEQVHWLLDPVLYRYEERNRAIHAAKPWLRECLLKAERFMEEAMDLTETELPPQSVPVSAYLAGYHLLRGAARLHNVPTSEELRMGKVSGDDSPEDVRLGYVEVGLTRHHLRVGQPLGTWEYVLRYQRHLHAFLPDANEVGNWVEAIFAAYRQRFAAALREDGGTDQQPSSQGGWP